jgi:truncated hemoglobin YjbI
MPKEVAHLHWSVANDVIQSPCFCNPHIQLDIGKLQATPETLAAIFGVRPPSALWLSPDEDANTTTTGSNGTAESTRLELVDRHHWPVQADGHYQVHVTDDAILSSVPINKIFETIGDEDKIDALSRKFYDRIWNDENTPADFRATFVSETSKVEWQARRQFAWFCEIWGGPSYFSSELERQACLVPRVMAQHTKSKMSFASGHPVTWLELMKAAVHEEFGDGDPHIPELLNLYWLHFFGFFAYSEEERAKLRRTVGY